MPNRHKLCCYCKQRSDQSDMVNHPAGWFCNQDHAVKYSIERSNKLRAKKDDELHKRRKEKFNATDKTVRREAAIRWCHKYILLRDHGKPCISCGAPWGSVKFSAGHFITAGSCTALRFDERNIHGQCWFNCNKNKSGNIVNYRKGLIARRGHSIVEFLEGPQPIIKITAEYYKSIENEYKAKCKQLEARAA